MMAARQPPVRQTHLAADMGLTPTSIGRFFKQLDADTIDDRVWAELVDLLGKRYGIDASVVRPVRATVTIDTSLTPYLDAFQTPQQLEALVHILEGSRKEQARDLLLVVARDRLARR